MTETNSVIRILVVEDEPAISAVCIRTLSSPETLVEVAVNGKVAIDMLKRGEYDRY